MSIENAGGIDFARPILPDPTPSTQAGTRNGPSFGEFLANAIGDVNELQTKAGDLVQRYATGDRIDAHQVMIALEQAGTAMALTTQVRNKILDAYTEIMRTNL
jgi:flagellar hook-basal body complex protein FliE